MADRIEQATPENTPMDLDELFEMIPEGTRIIIRDGRVTFENMTPELLEVALALNPDDPDLKARAEDYKKSGHWH